MKKITHEIKLFCKSRTQRRKKRESRSASLIKAKKLRNNVKLIGLAGPMIRYHNERRAFRRHFYLSRTYLDPPKTINIQGDFGIEAKENIDYFLSKSSEIIDFGSKELALDIRNCSKMWPSAVTMLCSLEQWVELSTWNRKVKPKIASSTPIDDKVTSYLYHCGFNNYVGLQPTHYSNYYNDDEVIKIRREVVQKNVENREDEILALLQKYTNFTKDEIEIFHTVILEIFLNVSEHGVTGNDNGWWVLAQYHPTHGIISVNIADNGIGIKNSLFTGPQKEVIKGTFSFSSKNDGDLIRYATETQVSGALTAVVKEKTGIFSKSRYPLGSKRGNGLDRIKSGCKKLGVELTLLSHFGYLFYDSNGNEMRCGTMQRRIFAGTLYHLNVPARKDVKI